MALIAPSLFSADFARLGEALEWVKAAGAPMIHLDVVDGHFAPGITAGQPVVKSLRRATDLILNVHLLVERPERYAAEFVAAGADIVSVHPESTANLHRVLEIIRAAGAKAGAALNPSTPVDAIADVMGQIDFLTVLTADTSLQEQAFIPDSFDKIRAAVRRRDERRLKFAIQVEGGLTFERVESVIRAGADILVAGSAIFDRESPKVRLADWIRLAAATTETQRV
ncbi:MAG TPA: ribulose-phosphate 3-epimerase [Terriglobia bacterium]|nr:ribulose-phosphate 3-epimerase [Terriglobia bacterium]